MNDIELKQLLERLVSLPKESELVEFKKNFHSKEEIGERISAMSNSACLNKQPFAYLIFGVEDDHTIKGTTFKAKLEKVGNEELELWLINRLNPKIDFQTFEFDYSHNIHISLYKIPATDNIPVKFLNESYIRINSSTRKLVGYPEKEKQIWKNELTEKFLSNIAMKNVSISDILKYLSTETYFDLMDIPYPKTTENTIDRLITEGIVNKYNNQYSITNLGAILFAKNINDFSTVSRKAIRVIKYKGQNKLDTERDIFGTKGYAIGFVGLIEWINGQLPENEQIDKVLRKKVRMYPYITIREIVANSIIHQDFSIKGFPTIEIYSDRIEISNPGIPIIKTERFIDEYVSRNEKLADIMRRMGFCEEKGSGMDKAVFNNELYQLPAININIQENRTIIILYKYKLLSCMNRMDKIRACYQHACLKYVSNENMTNQTLRERFGIEDKNSAIASRIIKDTLYAGMIKEEEPGNLSRKYKRYIPFWA
jgi:ATP-dependent DNA helicase RecG